MKYFFIGDRGISMRGLKKYMEFLGHQVGGSDLKSHGHKKENITSDIDVVVRTSAVNPGSPGWREVEEAEKRGIKIIKRSELLGQITKNKKLIAVSGMHGKTTISTMAGLLLINAGFDPTVLVGEEVKEFGNDVLNIGKSDWFVAEACEYDRSFLDFNPYILILTNIEEEHLDTFPGGIKEIKDVFVEYINRVRNDGVIIACYDDENVKEVLSQKKTQAKVIYYGFEAKENNLLDYSLKIPGRHNILNALSVVTLAKYLNIDEKIVKLTLASFQGAKRRFEHKGVFQESDLIDDYGHHPTEIRTTIEALKERYPDKKRIVVFWPHQYKRIQPLLHYFAKSFDSADQVLIKPIFFVPGRDEILNISSQDIVDLINKNFPGKALYFETDEEIVSYLRASLDNNSVLLTIGIPPVYKIIDKLLGENN